MALEVSCYYTESSFAQSESSVTFLIAKVKFEFNQAWFMDESSQDQRLPHHRNPKQFVSLDQLAGIQIIS